MHDRIYLIGFMGSGKTTHGNQLAKKLGWTFTDMDAEITAQSGLSIPEIFDQHGEACFRLREAELIRSLADQHHCVISTGGGVPCFHDNMLLMNRTGLTVYLKLPPAALLNRLEHSKTERPLLKGKSTDELLEFITSRLADREPYYNQAALIIDGHARVPDRIMDALSQ